MAPRKRQDGKGKAVDTFSSKKARGPEACIQHREGKNRPVVKIGGPR